MSASAIREAKHFTTSGRTEYLTPRFVIDALGPFDLDPCASITRPWPTAAKHYTIEDDGLARPWEGLVWLNPPFGPFANGCDCHRDDKKPCKCHTDKSPVDLCECEYPRRAHASEINWVHRLVHHTPGGILLSSPAKTETRMWQTLIFPHCDGILFLTPRLKFCNVDGSEMPGTFGATCLVAFGEEALERLRAAVFNGQLGGFVATVESMEGHRMNALRYGERAAK